MSILLAIARTDCRPSGVGGRSDGISGDSNANEDRRKKPEQRSGTRSNLWLDARRYEVKYLMLIYEEEALSEQEREHC